MRAFQLIKRYSRLWNAARNIKYVVNGLRVHRGVAIINNGDFRYGRRVTLGPYSLLDISKGARVELGDSVWTGSNVELQATGTIRIGDEVSIQKACTIIGDVQIGSYCIFAPNVYISSGNHYYKLRPEWLIRDQDALVRAEAQYEERRNKPVTIEEDCWIGINTVIMHGVTIGRGAVIGANSVVTRDVEPYTIVAGAPARILKKRMEFIPPWIIEAANTTSWPYFYRGFRQQRIRAKSDVEAYGGLVACSDFALTFKPKALKSQLTINARYIGDGQCTISYGGRSHALSSGYSQLSFLIDQADKWLHTFSVSKTDKHGIIAVAQAVVNDKCSTSE